MRPAITKGSFAMNVLAWNNYIEDMFFVRKIVPQRLAVCGKP